MRAICVTVKLPHKKANESLQIFMNRVTQDMRFRECLIKYSMKYEVTKTEIMYKANRLYIYRWRRRCDGTLESLRTGHESRTTIQINLQNRELKLMGDMQRRNPEAELVVFWVNLQQRGYSRTVTGLYSVLCRNGEMSVKPKNPKYIPKP